MMAPLCWILLYLLVQRIQCESLALEDTDFIAVGATTEDILSIPKTRLWNCKSNGGVPVVFGEIPGVTTMIVSYGINVRIQSVKFKSYPEYPALQINASCSSDGSRWDNQKIGNEGNKVEIKIDKRCPLLKLSSDNMQMWNFTTWIHEDEISPLFLFGTLTVLSGELITNSGDNRFTMIGTTRTLSFSMSPILAKLVLNNLVGPAVMYEIIIVDDQDVLRALTHSQNDNIFETHKSYDFQNTTSMFQIKSIEFQFADASTETLISLYFVYPNEPLKRDERCQTKVYFERFDVSPSTLIDEHLNYSPYMYLLKFLPTASNPRITVYFSSMHMISGLKLYSDLQSFDIDVFFSDGYSSSNLAKSHTLFIKRKLNQFWFDKKTLALYVMLELSKATGLMLQFYGCKLDQTYAVGLQHGSTQIPQFSSEPSAQIGLGFPLWEVAKKSYVVVKFQAMYRLTTMVYNATDVLLFKIYYTFSEQGKKHDYKEVSANQGVNSVLFSPHALFVRWIGVTIKDVLSGQPTFLLELYGSAKDYSQVVGVYDSNYRYTPPTVKGPFVFFNWESSNEFIEFSLVDFYVITGIINELKGSEMMSFVLKYSQGNDVFHTYNPTKKAYTILSSMPYTKTIVIEIEAVIGRHFRLYPVTSRDPECSICLMGEKLNGHEIVDDVEFEKLPHSSQATLTLHIQNNRTFYSHDYVYRGLSDDDTIGLSYFGYNFKADTDFFEPFAYNDKQVNRKPLHQSQSYLGLDQPESTHLKMPLSIKKTPSTTNFTLYTKFSCYNIGNFTLYITKKISAAKIIWSEQRPMENAKEPRENVQGNITMQNELINPFQDAVPVGSNVFFRLSLFWTSLYVIDDINIYVILSESLVFDGVVEVKSMTLHNITTKNNGRLVVIQISQMTSLQKVKSFLLKMTVVKPEKGFGHVLARSNKISSNNYYFSVVGKEDNYMYIMSLINGDVPQYIGSEKVLMKVRNDVNGGTHSVNLVTNDNRSLVVGRYGTTVQWLSDNETRTYDRRTFELERIGLQLRLQTAKIPHKRPQILCHNMLFYRDGMDCQIHFGEHYVEKPTLINGNGYFFVCAQPGCINALFSGRSACFYSKKSKNMQLQAMHPSITAIKSFNGNTEIIGITTKKEYIRMDLETGLLHLLSDVDERSFIQDKFLDLSNATGRTFHVFENLVLHIEKDLFYIKADGAQSALIKMRFNICR